MELSYSKFKSNSKSNNKFKSNSKFNSSLGLGNVESAYQDHLKFDNSFAININDYLIISDSIYLVENMDNNIYELINLGNNEKVTLRYPFQYVKIDGNDPNILRDEYIKIEKMK